MDLATVLVSSYQMYLISRSRLESYNSFNRHAMEITSRPKLKGKQFPLVGVGIFISPGHGNIHFSPGVEIYIYSKVWKYSFVPGCGNIHFFPGVEIFISPRVWKYSFLPRCGNIHFSPGVEIFISPHLCSTVSRLDSSPLSVLDRSKERSVLAFFCVLYKRTRRSFMFFIKKRSVLCVLLCSL